MGGLLSSWGYQVIETPSAEEAVAVLGNEGQDTPALVIADYELAGGKTGIDCISVLRTLASGPSRPFSSAGAPAAKADKPASRYCKSLSPRLRSGTRSCAT